VRAVLQGAESILRAPTALLHPSAAAFQKRGLAPASNFSCLLLLHPTTQLRAVLPPQTLKEFPQAAKDLLQWHIKQNGDFLVSNAVCTQLVGSAGVCS